jgi:hypothetical protein
MIQAVLLDPDGEHSDDYTDEVASAFTATIDVLNCASGSHAEQGLPDPGSVHLVIKSVEMGVGGMAQLFQQLGSRLHQLQQEGHFQVSHGGFAGRPEAAVAEVQEQLAQASAAAGDLFAALGRAGEALAWAGTGYEPASSDG